MSDTVDWDNSPEGAEFYSHGNFRKDGDVWNGCLWLYGIRRDEASLADDYQERPAQQEKPATQKQPATAAEYLSACAHVQLERGKQYDASGTGERSFDAAAEAFNCITGKHLRGSDVCLILVMVKLVRQYSDPARLHADSVLDMVSYASLLAEELTKELK